MNTKKKTIAVLMAAIMVSAVWTIVPMAMANQPQPDEVGTEVTVSSGGGDVPIVKCKWEQDTTVNLEDGDPTHQISGSQFNPSCAYKVNKIIQYFAVVTDTEDQGHVGQVYVDVYHPVNSPEKGSFKYEVPFKMLPKDTAASKTLVINLFKAADAAGLIHYDPPHTYTTVLNQLDKCTADLWMGEAHLSYHQPAGNYMVDAIAIDQNGNPSATLANTFLYVPVACCEIDFDSLNYGNVSICKDKWIAGDTVFNDPVGAAPAPNPATIRNIGNTHANISIHETDMGFGQDVTGMWNVEFDARLGSNPDNSVFFDPYQTVTLPNHLPYCNTDELDFSIHVKKGLSGTTYIGTKTISWVVDPF